MQNLAKAKAVSEDAEKERREKERQEAAETLTSNLTTAAGNALRAPESRLLARLAFPTLIAFDSMCHHAGRRQLARQVQTR